MAWNAGWGEYLVAWEHQNGSDDDVRGRRVSGAGALLGSEITVTSGAAEQTYPAVAANETGGGWTVAWQEGATNADIRAVHVDGTGDLLGVEEDISEAPNSQERPALAYDAARGRYLAVWADYRHAGSGPDVYGQLLRDYTTVVEYAYDPLSRLVGAEYSNGVQFGYEYDGAGNRTHLTETTPLSGTIATTYTYDKANHLKTRGVSDGRSYTYSWSQRGELLAERTQGVDVRTFEWDAAGRLAQASVFTLTTHFTYTGDGTRVALEVEGVGVTDSIPDRGGRILEERTATTSTRYLHGHECIGEVRDGTLLYYLADGQGYVRQSTGADGAMVDAWLFTPDGGVMAGPEGPVSHLVCGGVYDWSTGLLYKGERYFDPTLGIWLALGPLAVIQGWLRRRNRRNDKLVWRGLLVLVIFGVGGILVGCAPDTAAPTRVPTAVVKDLVCTDADTAYETRGFLLYGFSDEQRNILAVTIEAYNRNLGTGRLNALMRRGNGGEPRPVIYGPSCWGGEQILGGRSDILLGPAVFDMELAQANNFSSYGARTDSERAQIVFGHEIGHNLVGLDRAKWVESQDHGYKHSVPRDWGDPGAAEQEAVTNLALYVLDTGRLWNMPAGAEETDQANLTSINTWLQDVIKDLQWLYPF